MIVTRRTLAALVVPMAMGSEAAAQQVASYPIAPPDATVGQGFTRVTSVRELPDGDLLVADFDENRLYYVDWESGRVVPISRQGQGPGEYGTIGWIYPLAGDSTLLTDAQSRRWFLLDGLEVVETFVQSRDLNQFVSPRFSGSRADGGILMLKGVAWPDGIYEFDDSADSLGVVLVQAPLDPDGVSEMDTVARIGGPVLNGGCVPGGFAARRRGTSSPGDGARTAEVRGCHPMISHDQALLFPDGWIAVAYLAPYRVDWRTPDGAWIRGVPLPHSPVPMTPNERCAAYQGWSFRGLALCEGDVLEGFAWPESLPPFLAARSRLAGRSTAGLFAAPDGKLLIRRTPTSRSLNSRYDVIDRRGRLVGQIDMASNEAIVGFGAATVYTVVTDELDLQWLRRHPWR